MDYETIDIQMSTTHIGAEISGVDLSKPLSNEQLRDIYQVWQDWKVLVFRDQHIDREQHKAFAHHFGSLHPAPCGVGLPSTHPLRRTGFNPR
ncbi:MAG: TauD/TfdA family dioxygenase [Pseudomonadales bacterium]|jgi:taurine dioxygenase|nr:TauD/TfdA family dioxygenase [Pseudomonadales bacterium]MDP6471507.1 TauD/TfdA family dioxygenase [Pseudomonadales bacterium]MDP6829244.1 TauD/TfdA family dioxygenase [Pseudomonadales bacterium]MDP6970632.1 TauD/TfdA family dioxygenase [Pseudomonadales bacterium]|tara:strand:+ start:216 stop:491 length:276 start_codon:yes stop_codon:yes gene_type:complete